jgi:hypothetical protein
VPADDPGIGRGGQLAHALRAGEFKKPGTARHWHTAIARSKHTYLGGLRRGRCSFSVPAEGRPHEGGLKAAFRFYAGILLKSPSVGAESSGGFEPVWAASLGNEPHTAQGKLLIHRRYLAFRGVLGVPNTEAFCGGFRGMSMP